MNDEWVKKASKFAKKWKKHIALQTELVELEKELVSMAPSLRKHIEAHKTDNAIADRARRMDILRSLKWNRREAEDYIDLHTRKADDIMEDEKYWKDIGYDDDLPCCCSENDVCWFQDNLDRRGEYHGRKFSIASSSITVCNVCDDNREYEDIVLEAIRSEQKNLKPLETYLRYEEDTYPETIEQLIIRIRSIEESEELYKDSWRFLSADETNTYCLYCLIAEIPRGKGTKNYCLRGHHDICLCPMHYTKEKRLWLAEDTSLFYLARPFYAQIRAPKAQSARKGDFTRSLIPGWLMTNRDSCEKCRKRNPPIWLLFGTTIRICQICYLSYSD